jgi:hypothetical protein
MQLSGHADFLRPFIWTPVYGLMQFCYESDSKRASNFVRIWDKV